jgi:hypothetical protein
MKLLQEKFDEIQDEVRTPRPRFDRVRLSPPPKKRQTEKLRQQMRKIDDSREAMPAWLRGWSELSPGWTKTRELEMSV